MLRKNTAGQFLYFAGINATTGAALTGATFSVRRAIDGTFAAGGGTITEDTGIGFYKCALTQADTNGNDLAFFFTATNAIPVCINALTTATDPSTDTTQTGDAYARLGAPAGASVSADVAAVKVDTAAILVDTGTTLDARIPAALVSGRMDVSVGAMAANVITAAATAADFSAEVADQVWDEILSGHAVSGSTGEALSAAGGAGDPWITALPGAYGAGSAGYIVGTNLNATVSSRATQTSVDTIDDLLDTEVAAIKSDTAAILIDTAEIGVAGAGLTALASASNLAVVAGYLDTEIAAIKAVTDALPNAGALTTIQADLDDIQTRIPAALSSGNMKVDVLAISGSTAAADNLEESTEVIGYGTCTTGGSTTSVVASAVSPASAVNDQYNGRVMIFKGNTTAALAGQATTISDYDHTSLTFTVVALTTAPASGDLFVIL